MFAKNISTAHLSNAPVFDTKLKPYKYFDYKKDLLSIECNVCEGEFSGSGLSGVHNSAIDDAVEFLLKDVNAATHLGHLRLTYCFLTRSASDIAEKFNKKANDEYIFPALKIIQFVNHGHPIDDSDDLEHRGQMENEIVGWDEHYEIPERETRYHFKCTVDW